MRELQLGELLLQVLLYDIDLFAIVDELTHPSLQTWSTSQLA